MRFMKALVKSFSDFFRDGGLMLAGSLSYFSMMAIVPFCLLLATIFGYFLGEEKAFYQFLSARLTSYFPDVTHEITEELRRLITYIGTIYGPLSAFVIFLLWVFYSACIFLLGAEVVHNLEVSREKKR